MYNIKNMYHNCRPHDKEIDRQVPIAEAAIIGGMLGHGMDSPFTTKILILSKPYLLLYWQVPVAEGAINDNGPGDGIKLSYLIKLVTLDQNYLLLHGKPTMVRATINVTQLSSNDGL